jgi:hypothetical protein
MAVGATRAYGTSLEDREILVLGDSLSCVPGTPPGLGYPAYLAAMLPVSSTVTTMAWGGYGVEQIYAAAHSAIIAGTWTDLVVLGGVNNIAGGQSALYTLGYMNSIYNDAQTIKARLIGIEMTPWVNYVGYSVAKGIQSETYNRYLHTHRLPWRVVNTHSMGNGSWELLPAYDFGDHLHMTPEGQQYLADLVYAGLQ